MNITKAQTNTIEQTVALGSVSAGAVFRYAHLSFTTAIKEDAFYMVMKQPEKKGISTINLHDGLVIVRDPDHRVVVHNTNLAIDE